MAHHRKTPSRPARAARAVFRGRHTRTEFHRNRRWYALRPFLYAILTGAAVFALTGFTNPGVLGGDYEHGVRVVTQDGAR